MHPKVILLILLCVAHRGLSQCPSNIGFEDGNFQNWECFSGTIGSSGNFYLQNLGPQPNRHVIINSSVENALDPFGHFPVTSPNGSKYSVKLGNDDINGEAERISYTFTVPVGRNDYSIVYNYAIVFEDPGHPVELQPRFTSKVFDIANNQYIDCSSFDYVAGYSLSEFTLADTVIPGRASSVYYKTWSAVTIKLQGYAGKTVRLEFTTNDCVLLQHFGYAYIDVNENCAPAIEGNSICMGQTSAKLIAPLGYQDYRWHDAGFTNLLGSKNMLTITPAPAAGTVYAVILKPFFGSACLDTLYTTIQYVNASFVFDVIDPATFCKPSVADLRVLLQPGNTSGLYYSFYNDSSTLHIRPPFTQNSGIYYIKASGQDNCVSVKPVTIAFNDPPSISISNPPPLYYTGTADITNPTLIRGNTSGITFTYWQDAAASNPLVNPTTIRTAGTYYIKATKGVDCSVIKAVSVVNSIKPPPNAFSPNGDGVNDVWHIPELENHLQCNVDIFNRFGQRVYASSGYNKPWDGTMNGKKLPAGVYYYLIRFLPQFPPLYGWVTILY